MSNRYIEVSVVMAWSVRLYLYDSRGVWAE